MLEAFPDSRELAQALSGRAQLAMNGERVEEAIALGTRAVRLARRLDDAEIVAHGLTNVGTVLIGGPDTERGRALLEEAFVLATGVGEDDHAARALVNLATATLMRRRDDPRVDADVERALRFAPERELDGYVQYMLGVRANLRLRRGEWRGGRGRRARVAGARRAVRRQPVPGADRARAPAGATRRRRRPARRSRRPGSARWPPTSCSGSRPRRRRAPSTRGSTATSSARSRSRARRTSWRRVRGDAWARAELAFWLWRGGAPVEPQPDDPAPYARSLAGDWRGGGRGWEHIGCPYERAEALSEADDEDARLEALRVFDEFGAARAASHLRRRLRADGVRRIPRGPRAASRSGPAGLTPRETEVLDLIVHGDTNAQIAQALVITPKTVDHHVSAVLSKLGVSSRREAGAALERLAD